MDLWILIGEHLHGHPYSVILLSMVNRYLRDLFSSQIWWNSFYEKVVLYQTTQRKVSKYARKMKQIRDILTIEEDNSSKKVINNKSRHTLNLVFGSRCQHCGCTRGHYLFKSLMMRSCIQCLRKNWISNSVLYFHYGLSYYDFIEEYYYGGGMLIPSYAYNCDDLVSLGLSLRKRQYKKPISSVDLSYWSNALEKHKDIRRCIRKHLEGSLLFDSGSLISLKGGSSHLLHWDQNLGSPCYYHHCQFAKIKETDAHKSQILFWKPDLERILHIDFKSLENEQIRRIKAAQFLTALCARLANYHFHLVNLKLPILSSTLYCEFRGVVPSSSSSSWASVIQNDNNNNDINLKQKQQLVIKQKYIEKLRPMYKLCLPRTWIPGGPFFAYYDSTFSPRRLSDFWWRPGFDMHKYDFINQIIIRKYKHKLCRRYFASSSSSS